MKKIGHQEIRGIQLNVLRKFHEICAQNNFTYSLYAGTLIGAMRHGGFIPWDDDIDVAMPREDYEKFLKKFESSNHPGYLHLYDYRKDDSYNYPFMKLADSRTYQVSPGKEAIDGGIGLHIDIFAIDGLPKSRWLAIAHLRMLRLMRHCGVMSSLRLGIKGRSLVKKIALFLFKIVTFGAKSSFWNRLHNYCAARYSLADSRWGGNAVWGYAERELVPVHCYKGSCSVCFENEVFNAFSGADEYLRIVYGDYMKPPPVEQQVGVHVVDAYMKNED